MATLKIALLGDSLLESWGPECPELRQELKRQFPRSEPVIDNHGVAGTRAGYGLWRLTNDYDHNGTRRRGLSYGNPGVVVVESFAYTQHADGPEGLDEYRDLLRRIFDELHQTTAAKVLLAIGMPPLREQFLENVPAYAHTSAATRQRMADDVLLYQKAARDLAHDENWPVADVAVEVERRVANGEHPRRFINGADNLHPSQYGHFITARTLLRALDENRMIEESHE